MKLMTAQEARELSESHTLRARNLEKIAQAVYVEACKGNYEVECMLEAYTEHDFIDIFCSLQLKGYRTQREADSNLVKIIWSKKEILK